MHNKQTVRRLVEEAVNGGRDELIDARFTRDMTAWVRDWFGAVSPLLPDIHMELVPAGGGS